MTCFPRYAFQSSQLPSVLPANAGFANTLPLGRQVPQGLKPTFFQALNGTAKAVPYPRPTDETISNNLLLARACGLLAIELALIQIRHRHRRTLRRLDTGRNPVHGAQNHQFRVALLGALAFEEIAEDGDIAQSRNLVLNVRDPVIQQAGNDETLTILQFEFGLRLARADGGYGGSGDGDGVREVQRTDLGSDVQVDAAVRLNHGSELQAHAKLAKLNGDGGDSAGVLLRYRKGKFSSGQETGLFAVHRNQVGLGQNLQEIFLMQGLDDCSQVDVGAFHENIQKVADGGGRGRRRDRGRRRS